MRFQHTEAVCAAPQLGYRFTHILRRMLPIAMFLLQRDSQFLTGHDLFLKRVGASYHAFLEHAERQARHVPNPDYPTPAIQCLAFSTHHPCPYSFAHVSCSSVQSSALTAVRINPLSPALRMPCRVHLLVHMQCSKRRCVGCGVAPRLRARSAVASVISTHLALLNPRRANAAALPGKVLRFAVACEDVPQHLCTILPMTLPC